jgi:hypothetical protein
MNDKTNTKTKADLYAMLAEAVRNTTPTATRAGAGGAVHAEEQG